MTLKDMRYYLLVCQHKSIRKAAPYAFISPQGLTKVIHNLESMVQVPLFVNSRGRRELTEYGQRFREYAEQVVAATDAMEQDMARLRTEKAGTIHLAYSRILSATKIINYLEDFQEEYPQYPLAQAKAADTDVHSLALGPPPMLALSVAPVPPGNFVVERVGRFRYVLLASRQHPLAQKQELHQGDLAGQKLILLDSSHMAHQNIVEACRRAGVAIDVAYEASGGASTVRLCKQNKGVAVLMRFLTEELDLEGLQIIPFADDAPTWDAAFLYPQGYALSEPERILIQYIRQKMARSG